MNGVNNNLVLSPDGDSLVALDALLRIRKSGALDSFVNNATLKAQNGEQYGTRETFASSMNTNPSSSLPSHLAARLNSLLPLNAASMLFASTNQHKVSIANSAAQYRLAAATNWSNSLLAGHVRSLSQPGPPSPNSLRRESVDLDSDTNSTSGKKGESDLSTSIRQEKVAEALRSKPQRGRKRDDLNETERLELTRTRNREHAKSTRIRKKARYQELLDREELYLQMREQEEIQEQRRQSVRGFLSLRQNMLLGQKKLATHDQQSGETSSSRPSAMDEALQWYHVLLENTRLELSELIDATLLFEFESLLPGGANADSDDAISKMFEWDEAFVDRVKSAFGSRAARVLGSVKYEIESGCEGIALNKGGTAFCRVEIFAQIPSESENLVNEKCHTDKAMLMAGLCCFKFNSVSNRLTSMKWTTLEDRVCVGTVRFSGGEMESNSNKREYLGSQLVHPSVVSLDHGKQNDAEETHEPGMCI